MKKKSETILFFGSGPVAARSLELLAREFTVEAVVTKPSTRDEMSAITNAPVYAVSSKAELDTLFAGKPFNSPVGVVIDFGIIISRSVIDYFPLGIINSHFSLLPEWRGADPITFAVLSGQNKTGISLMLIDEKMDEGPLLAQKPYVIRPNETTPSLTEQLIMLSNETLSETLPAWQEGSLQSFPQSGTPSYSRKITKADGNIDWQKPAEVLEREVRAYQSWPKSHASLGTIDVVIISSKVADKQGLKPGEITIEGKEIIVGCGESTALSLLILKPAGKKEMPASSFLAGYKNRILQA